MMGTSNPRPRGAPSVSGELQKARADREQTRRLLSRTPKAAPAKGGGPVGWYTKAEPSNRTVTTSKCNFSNWTFLQEDIDGLGSGPDLLDVPQGPVTYTCFSPTEAGWYVTKTHFACKFLSGGPALIEATINTGSLNLPGRTDDTCYYSVTVPMDIAGGFTMDHPSTPMWVPADSTIGVFGLTLNWATLSVAPTLDWMDVWIDVTRVA